MRIELLFVSDCPNHAIARDHLNAALSAEGVETEVEEILVADSYVARLFRFPGSPTIRINGRDIEQTNQSEACCGLMCRLYLDGSGAPSERHLRQAIRMARHEEI
jgi:Domain of unknown function (DUF2703)